MSAPTPAPAPYHLRHSRPTDWLLWGLRRWRRWRVVGPSMEPLLTPGEEVLMRPGIYRRSPPQPGDIVVAYHPHRPGFLMVKWVASVDPSDGCYLLGLNLDHSTDSRQLGWFPLHLLLGRVECRLP